MRFGSMSFPTASGVSTRAEQLPPAAALPAVHAGVGTQLATDQRAHLGEHRVDELPAREFHRDARRGARLLPNLAGFVHICELWIACSNERYDGA
jgi:hypothetical protein